jgi:hypothetical protein
MNRLLTFIVLLSAAGPSAAHAEPYWVTYEANDLPENEGWERYYGNWEGPGQGGGYRTVEDGILTIDSLYDDGVVEGAIYHRPGQLDPDSGELFIAEWRLNVDEVYGWGSDAFDPAVTVTSDEGWIVGIGYGADTIYSYFEDDVSIPYAPDVFHEFLFTSWDMRTYELYMDGELVHEGAFWEGLLTSYLAWGDGVQGAASLSHWDYARFGVVPEPSCLLLGTVLLLGVSTRRKL